MAEEEVEAAESAAKAEVGLVAAEAAPCRVGTAEAAASAAAAERPVVCPVAASRAAAAGGGRGCLPGG